ncbi:MAG: tetratricopeptide repeat protein [Ignavibacteriaceae bacterium]|nr:tetratricopeptide repeat protein [Ignavibacteriaceae bacterium]
MFNRTFILILFSIFTFISIEAQAQTRVDILKVEATRHMGNGRYGEAIDLLNKYIAARPKQSDGLHLRGLSYEKREQYEYSVFDLRQARKIDPKNPVIAKDLARVEATWHKLLRKKIAGHKREIKIDPSIPLNYLEIGKSHKHLGEWLDAEWWYDEYIKREDPSPDEVIRYCEILLKNKHIEKGEKILKKYVELFPKDHRLWSRYGYFTMWLGKRKIAQEAFKTALGFRPFFREAQEGLEQAEERPYIYTNVDTFLDLEKYKRGIVQQEYYIDRLIREVRNSPDDVDRRYSLIDALLGVNRIQEAYENLQVLSSSQTGTERFDPLWQYVTGIRDSIRNAEIEILRARYQNDKNDKEAVIWMAETYAKDFDYENSISILTTFLNNNRNGNNDVRYLLARYTAYNKDYETSIDYLTFLIKSEPENLDYKLLRAMVAVWMSSDIDLAKAYLEEYLAKDPNKLDALISYANVLLKGRDFTSAAGYIERARAVAPDSREIETIQNYYDALLELEDERKINDILVEGQQLAMDQNCSDAVLKYDEYFEKRKSPPRNELIQYIDVNMCAKNYTRAIEVCDQLLEQEYDRDIAIMRAKSYLWSGDSVRARDEFNNIISLDSTSFDAKLYLAQSYESLQEYDSAQAVYERLLTETVDPEQINLINLRMGWLPRDVSMPFTFNINVPLYFKLGPTADYYSDSQNLLYYNTGGMVEAGITENFSVGANLNRTIIETIGFIRYYTTLKWNLIANIKRFYVSAGFGNQTYRFVRTRKVKDFAVKYFFNKLDNISLTYDNTDAATVLLSARLGLVDIDADVYRLSGRYNFSSGSHISGYYRFLALSDGNRGSDIIFRFGRKFQHDILGGYEYLYANYQRTSTLYYSPQNFAGHSIWAEWERAYNTELTYTLGVKAGYIPYLDSFIREFSVSAMYEPLKNFFLSGRLGYSGTYRYDGSYEFFSGYILAYWTIL